MRGRGAAERQQHVAGHQQDLEADVEVEQVAGQEGVAHAGRRGPGRSGGRSTAGCPRRRRPTPWPTANTSTPERHGRGDDQHQRRQPVDDQHDAQRHRPAADGDRGRAVGVGHAAAARPTPPARRSAPARLSVALRPRVPAEQQRHRPAPSSGSRTGSGARTLITGRPPGRSTSSAGGRRVAGRRRRRQAVGVPGRPVAGREVVGVELVGVGAFRGRRPGGPPRRCRPPPAGPAATSGGSSPARTPRRRR